MQTGSLLITRVLKPGVGEGTASAPLQERERRDAPTVSTWGAAEPPGWVKKKMRRGARVALERAPPESSRLPPGGEGDKLPVPSHVESPR